MNNNVLEIKDLSKAFGHKEIFRKVNLRLEGGNIYGLIGPNGSGKSVFLKIVCGLMSAEGSIYYNGNRLTKQNAYEANIGASIEKPQFIEELSGMDNFLFLASFRRKLSIDKINKWFDMFDLTEAAKKPVKAYSLGMKQKLAIIQAVMEDQNIILLDEVSNSLDRKTKGILFDLILRLKKEGKIIVYVNHNLDEVMKICDQVMEISEGEIVRCENIS